MDSSSWWRFVKTIVVAGSCGFVGGGEWQSWYVTSATYEDSMLLGVRAECLLRAARPAYAPPAVFVPGHSSSPAMNDIEGGIRLLVGFKRFVER